MKKKCKFLAGSSLAIFCFPYQIIFVFELYFESNVQIRSWPSQMQIFSIKIEGYRCLCAFFLYIIKCCAERARESVIVTPLTVCKTSTAS